MKKKIMILVIAVILNAFGQSIMAQTEFGMTAWGMAGVNLEKATGISLGLSFIILSTFAYIIATLIRRRLIISEMIQSFIFLFAFGFLTDVFVFLIPNMALEPLYIRFIANFIGLLVLLFSIAMHLKVGLAIHPMDVYLKEIQNKVNSVRYGTYISYSSAFVIGLIFGLLDGYIHGIHFGTIYALLLSGLIFDFYNKFVLHKLDFTD